MEASMSPLDILSKIACEQIRILNLQGATHQDNDGHCPESNAPKITKSSSNRRHKKSCNSKKVPIGDGHAVVPARLLRNMQWTSHTKCTRKLLSAVFPREVLATHTLTGKASPAFPNKPAKNKLDQRLVNDVISTVVEMCGVSEGQVRTCITTKCADECKMARMRSLKRRKNERHKGIENVSHPSTSSAPQSTA